MSSAEIRVLVDRGLEVKRQIAKLEKELEGIEAKLEEAGLHGEHHELKDSDREGRRFLARGTNRILPITFTADKLVKTFKKDSALHKTLKELVDEKLKEFYLPTTTYEMKHDDGKAFRAAADHVLGKDLGPQLITACLARDKTGTPKSDVKIEWGKAEEIVEP